MIYWQRPRRQHREEGPYAEALQDYYLRRENSNPYDLGTHEHQRYERGFDYAPEFFNTGPGPTEKENLSVPESIA